MADDNSKLTLFAVGDDDQNIYSFKGSSVKFIRSFEQDYKAQPAYLIHNYRSTGHIIEAANAVIEPAQNRMKENHTILINKHRQVVLDGGWERTSREDHPDASRRLYYVSMTRARHTLTLMHFGQPNRLHSVLKGHPSVMHRELLAPPPAAPELQRRYQSLSLNDVDIDFSGRKPPRDRVHAAITALSPKDPLTLRLRSGQWVILDHLGTTVGKLAKKFRPPRGMECTRASVRAIIVRFHRQSRPEFQERLRCERWEVVLPELIFEPEAGQDQAVQASPLRSRSSL